MSANYQLGDTVRQRVAPKFTAMRMDESLRRSLEEMAWRNNPLDFPMPEHIKAETVYIILDTQEKVDEYNAQEGA